jgi:hypothetical protein
MVVWIAPIAQAGPFLEQLRKECDALLQTSIKRPYGIGFDPSGSPDTRRPTTRPVSLEPRQSPAAGVVLLWAGDLLDEPRYRNAAIEVAKATMTAQHTTGQFPSITIFAAKPTGRDESQIYPERSATICSLGLLMATVAGVDAPDSRTKGAISRGMHWLGKQRSGIGAWPSAVQKNPEDKEYQRVIRLDELDFRNGVFAHLLQSEILSDKDATREAAKSLDLLLRMRIGSVKAEAPALWCGVYTLEAQPAPGKLALPESPDLLATRYSLQTLLAGYLFTGDRRYGMAVDEAFKSLDELKMRENMWRRFPDAKENNEPPPMFGVASSTEFGALGLPTVLNSARQMKLLGREKFVELTSTQFTPRQHLIASMVGLWDEPLSADLPVAASEVPTYLEKNLDRFSPLSAPFPETLEERTQRLWLLLLRARIEHLTEK